MLNCKQQKKKVFKTKGKRRSDRERMCMCVYVKQPGERGERDREKNISKEKEATRRNETSQVHIVLFVCKHQTRLSDSYLKP